jgi:RimJ/RimL family protein N-acetyltransferase
VRLEPLGPEHLELFWRWRSQASTRRFNPLARMSRREALDHLEECRSNLRVLAEHAKYRWLVRVDGEPVGAVSLGGVNRRMGIAEVGLAIGEEFHGRGYGTLAARALVHKAFAESPLRRLVAYVHARNEASARVLEKLGFRREGLLREHYLVNGKPADELVYGLLRREWRG